MRKIISFGLFSILVWQIIGFVGCFEFSHYKLKKDIKTALKRGISKEHLVAFELSESELQQLTWLNKHEFEFNGNLYDVVRKHKTQDGKYSLECISDTKEKELFTTLDQTISANLGDDTHESPVSYWFKILNFPIVQITENPYEFSHLCEIKAKNLFLYSKGISSFLIEIPSPPPQS